MLLLKRNVGEVIVIDGTIRVMVTGVGDGWARIGIEAPKEVRIDRLEVHEERAGYAAKEELPR